MRDLADEARIRRFMREFGRAARRPARVYFTGGATAVLSGWRASTIDIDLKLVPDDDALLRAIPELKESLHVNVELAAPADFIPVKDGWEDRSRFIAQEGPLAFYDYDLTAQALSKIERGHAQDLQDVREMIGRGLVEPASLRETFRRRPAAVDLKHDGHRRRAGDVRAASRRAPITRRRRAEWPRVQRRRA